MNVCFDTFGCRLNKAEALQIEAEYIAKGWRVVKKHAEADLIIVRGCSVTARAQHECEHFISRLRLKYPRKNIKVEGCLPNRQTHEVSVAAPKDALPTRTARAYLKVQDGCSGQCTFCIVPQFRGKSQSVAFCDVIDRAQRFIDAGYHEIVVTGCNLSLYASNNKRLPELITALAELDQKCRVRLGSLEPGSCALETVSALAEKKNACRFLHIPIQSGSPEILRAMKRPYDIQDVENLIARATDLMPNLGLGCDLMTGFPSESAARFLSSKKLLMTLPFTNAHIFPYSERPNTPAASLPQAIPSHERSHRAHELATIISTKRKKFAESFIGKDVEIIVEDKTKCIGWTSEYISCKAFGSAPRKSLAKIRVLRRTGDQLYGQLIQEAVNQSAGKAFKTVSTT